MLVYLGLGAMLLMGAPEERASPPKPWVVMPVRAEHPPPQDPTLLRLSVPLAKAIAAEAPAAVRLAKRDERDERCLDDGWRCPDEIAAMLGAGRVISMQLDEDHGALTVYVYAGRQGVIAEQEVACTWSDGRLSCDVKALSNFFAGLRPRTLGPEEVFDAFAELHSPLQACTKKGRTRNKVQVVFRVGSDGQAHHVRIQPRKHQRSKVYRCMAQVVEGLQVRPFLGPTAGPYTFTLPTRERGKETSTP